MHESCSLEFGGGTSWVPDLQEFCSVCSVVSIPFQSAPLHAGNCLCFCSGNLCSLECSEVMARTFPSCLVNEIQSLYVCKALG